MISPSATIVGWCFPHNGIKRGGDFGRGGIGAVGLASAICSGLFLSALMQA